MNQSEPTAVREDDVWEMLNEVMDPELPYVSVIELGIIRNIDLLETGVQVDMTPTFSGCPALHVIQRDIAERLHAGGFTEVSVAIVLSPPWSSDWITDSGREKLRQLGIAPPRRHGGQAAAVAFLDVAVCPRCQSTNATLKNAFGPTLCKTVWYCHDCQDAFEQFKVL